MKKILALLMAFAMIFAFAACNKDKEDAAADVPAHTTKSDDQKNAGKDKAQQQQQQGGSEVTEVVTDASGEAVTNEAGDIVVEAVTDASGEVVTEAPPADAGFNSVDFDEIAAFYQAAATKTATDEKDPAGNQTMVLVGEISGDGAIGTVLEVLNPIVADVLAENSTTTDYVPGANRGDLLGSDISDAYAYTEDGKTYVYIELKDQTDGPDCDGHEAGPVARGIGTLGSIDTALEALGAEINSGRDTVTLTYNQAYIECVVNEDGYVESGTWHYVVDVNIGDAKAKISFLSANLKNLKASIEYTVIAG